jgi:hypothetical protein
VTDGLHAAAERRSLELHRAVAERLRADPALVERARDRVARWLREGTVARPYAEAWQAALGRPLEELAGFLVDPGEHACRMRQTSPFAGVLDPRTRWSIWRRAREGAGRR